MGGFNEANPWAELDKALTLPLRGWSRYTDKHKSANKSSATFSGNFLAQITRKGGKARLRVASDPSA